jgi:T5SS/PEP-CTERM-associated repeat protein
MIAASMILARSQLAGGAISISGDALVTPGNPSGQVRIGDQGLGTLTIDGGSVLTSGNSQIGISNNGIGTATVTGAGSQWNVGSTMDVGSSGIGRLNILNGGAVNYAFSPLRIGLNSTAHGTVLVENPGSVLQAAGGITVGATSGGSALLRIADDAIVNSSSAQFQIMASGRVELDGGLLRTGQFSNNGVISGSGEVLVAATSISTSLGRFEAGLGDVLRVNGAMINYPNQGIIAADGGTIDFQRAVLNNPSGSTAGEITLRNALVRVGSLVTSGPQLTNQGLLAAIGGLNDFYGRITNGTNGHIAVTNQSVMVFHDDVTAVDGTITVFPGSSAIFLEDLVVGEEAVLLADLAGTGADTGFGDIEVVGAAQLSGSLAVTLAGDFMPQAGDAFRLLTASEISGGLALGAMPELPAGLKWDLDTQANHVVLSVVPGLAGDYNSDGTVDAGDYIVWRVMAGQSGPGLAADGNGDNTVDGQDHQFWMQHFGNSLNGGAATHAAVPEPNSMAALFIGMLLVSRRRRVLHYGGRYIH